jgi:hypothetical protein
MNNEKKLIAPIPKRSNSHPFVSQSFSRSIGSSRFSERVSINSSTKKTLDDGFDVRSFGKECQEQEDKERASEEILNILINDEERSTASNTSDGSRCPRQTNPFLKNLVDNDDECTFIIVSKALSSEECKVD